MDEARQKTKVQADTIRHRKRLMVEAMTASLGIVSVACKKVNINRDTFYVWYKKDPKFKAKIDDIGEISLDFVESALLNQIKDSNTTATIFYLKTKGKDRGYIERKEITGVDGKDLIPARTLTKEEAQEFLTKLENEC